MEWYGGSSHRQRSAVVITSEPSSPSDDKRDYPVSHRRGIEIEVCLYTWICLLLLVYILNVKFKVWTNSEVASDIITAQHPLAIFAKVWIMFYHKERNLFGEFGRNRITFIPP